MQSPLLGFNNNVKHRGRLFHIQTEDSGIRHPHVITHLFMDGGRILKSIKTSYAEQVGNDRLFEFVRTLMKEQHKTMFIALRDGQFDHVFAGESAPKAPEGASMLPSTSMLPRPSMLPGVSGPDVAERPSGLAPPADQVAPGQEPMPAGADATLAPSKATGEGASATDATAFNASSALSADSIAPPEVPSLPPLTRRFGTLIEDPGRPIEAPAVARPFQRREAPVLFVAGAPVEAPVNVVAQESLSAEPSISENAAGEGAENVEPGESPAPPNSTITPKKEKGSGRYAASRPAAIFGTAKNPDAGGSIFGDDLISEKSLDEVILSYLSDDLDGTSKK